MKNLTTLGTAAFESKKQEAISKRGNAKRNQPLRIQCN